MQFRPGEQSVERLVRFRSLGCYPLSAAVTSSAASLEEIVAEMRTTRESERAGRLIDQDQDASMEKKKREGYF
jgi:sulfate adenylyltransferase subunit 2